MLTAITDCREEREIIIKLLLAYLMTNTKTIFAIAALAAFLTAVPLLDQEADATIVFVPNKVGAITFQHTTSFQYDMNAIGYERNTTPIDGNNSNVHINGMYDPISNAQTISWDFPPTVNLMYDRTEVSSLSEFTLESVEYTIISDGNGQIDGASNQALGYDIHRDQMSDSGNVYITVVGNYVWTPMGTP